MPLTDGPFTDYDQSTDPNHPYAQRFIPSGRKVRPGSIQLAREAILGAPTQAAIAALMPGNYLDLQYKTIGGDTHFLRVVYHAKSGTALYCYTDERSQPTAFQIANIVGMSVII